MNFVRNVTPAWIAGVQIAWMRGFLIEIINFFLHVRLI